MNQPFDDTVRLIDEATATVRRGYHISISGYVDKSGSGDGPDEIRRCTWDRIMPLDRLLTD